MNSTEMGLLVSNNSEETGSTDFSEFWDSPRTLHLSVYTAFISGLFIMTIIRTVGFFKICMRSSIALHRQLFYGVLRAPMDFFAVNPVGEVEIKVINATIKSFILI